MVGRNAQNSEAFLHNDRNEIKENGTVLIKLLLEKRL